MGMYIRRHRAKGPAGAGTLSQVVNAALSNTERFAAMQEFFTGVGTSHAAGIWNEQPRDRPEFRERYRGQLAKLAKARKSEEMI